MKGIVDPWRVVEPLQKPEPSPVLEGSGKVDLSQIDFDRDIRVAQYYVIRAESGSIEVRSIDITKPADALVRLASCLWQLAEAKTLDPETGIGVGLRGRSWNIPTPEQPGTKLATPEDYEPAAMVYFAHQTYDNGMLRLIRALNAARRRPGPTGADLLTRWGITPMMR